MPLYDILNEFQKGSSHMAAVVRTKGRKNSQQTVDKAKAVDYKETKGNSDLMTPLLEEEDENFETYIDIEKSAKPLNASKKAHFQVNVEPLAHSYEDIEEGEVIGIITLEDVFEELLQVRFISILHLSKYWMLKLVNPINQRTW